MKHTKWFKMPCFYQFGGFACNFIAQIIPKDKPYCPTLFSKSCWHQTQVFFLWAISMGKFDTNRIDHRIITDKTRSFRRKILSFPNVFQASEAGWDWGLPGWARLFLPDGVSGGSWRWAQDHSGRLGALAAWGKSPTTVKTILEYTHI